MLAEFRSRAAPPPPSQHSGGGYVSMREHYEKLVDSNVDGAGGRGSTSIRESLRSLQPNGAGNPGRTESLSFSLFTETLGNKADPNAGGSVKLVSPFSKEKKKGKGGVGAGSATMELWTSHERWSLGKKLMKMRPEKRDGKWFSLQELSDRLAKVRMADQEKLKKLGFPVEAINKSFKNITQDKEEKDRARSLFPSSDNTSSAEKMKLELQKVKRSMSCSCTRVSVHLSSRGRPTLR